MTDDHIVEINDMVEGEGTGLVTLFRNKYRVESARLQKWDYSSPGCYFVTVCTFDRLCLFGDVEKQEIRLNEFGTTVNECWNELPAHYCGMKPDAFVVMPNHIHAVIRLIDITGGIDVDVVETGLKPVSTNNTNTKRHGLSEIIRGFKTFSARRINAIRKTPGHAVWQPRFHDHIIRNQKSLFQIRQYIRNNPSNWGDDEENPLCKSPRYVAMLNPQSRRDRFKTCLY